MDRSAVRLERLYKQLHPEIERDDGASSSGLHLEAEPVWGGGMERRAAPLEVPRGRRAVIVAGARTPFIRSFGDLQDVNAIGLGVSAVKGLLDKTKLDPNHVDEIVWGNVVLTTAAPNVAREIVLDLHLPPKISGVTVSRACLSGLQAIMQAVHMIEHGDADCVIAGGSDSMSNAELTMPRKFSRALANFSQAKKKDFKAVTKFLKEAGSPMTWMPQAPAIAERSTGRTMGYHADLMAEINKVPRDSQERFAAASHRNAAAAQKAGKLAEEIVPVLNPAGKTVTADNLIRGDSDPAKMSRLRTVFRKSEQGGTVTAATSSPLTDGASAVLVMSEEMAARLGYATDIVFRSFAFAGVDPFPQLLLAPAIAIPEALDNAGLTLDDIDLFEVHEAFAAQVLSTIKCLESPEFAREYLHRDRPVGTMPLEKVNVNGSSIAVGHPFSATGGRLVTSAANELRRTGKRFALLSICAAGGLGGVAIIERRV